MAATKRDISDWFDWGKRDGGEFMIVACDTFDHEDYPVYTSRADFQNNFDRLAKGDNMQRIMEVYDLNQPKDPQMDEHRCWRLPT